jgi:hypothetical protein
VTALSVVCLLPWADGFVHHSAEKGDNHKREVLEKAVIAYFVDSRDIPECRRSLRLLLQNFLHQFPYPVVLFYDENNFSEENRAELSKYTKSLGINAFIEKADFDLPYNVKETDPIIVNDLTNTPLEYKKMIRFWFRNIFFNRFLFRFEYVMRLDCASAFLDKITFDPFRYMRERQYLYAYRQITEDYPFVTVGFMDFVDDYMRNHPNLAEANGLQIPPPGERTNFSPKMFATNFEILNLRRFRRSDFNTFEEMVDHTREIFWHRWGDGPLRYHSIMLFLNVHHDVWHFCNNTYEHTHTATFLTDCSENDFEVQPKKGMTRSHGRNNARDQHSKKG